ncbi:hypothetical protein B0H11DRAFT_2201790 [Mycena galericulata]|nr:hypothetical protein B0H11DRAFT_2201790 [Mycena galericulata]
MRLSVIAATLCSIFAAVTAAPAPGAVAPHEPRDAPSFLQTFQSWGSQEQKQFLVTVDLSKITPEIAAQIAVVPALAQKLVTVDVVRRFLEQFRAKGTSLWTFLLSRRKVVVSLTAKKPGTGAWTAVEVVPGWGEPQWTKGTLDLKGYGVCNWTCRGGQGGQSQPCIPRWTVWTG